MVKLTANLRWNSASSIRSTYDLFSSCFDLSSASCSWRSRISTFSSLTCWLKQEFSSFPWFKANARWAFWKTPKSWFVLIQEKYYFLIIFNGIAFWYILTYITNVENISVMVRIGIQVGIKLRPCLVSRSWILSVFFWLHGYGAFESTLDAALLGSFAISTG